MSDRVYWVVNAVWVIFALLAIIKLWQCALPPEVEVRRIPFPSDPLVRYGLSSCYGTDTLGERDTPIWQKPTVSCFAI